MSGLAKFALAGLVVLAVLGLVSTAGAGEKEPLVPSITVSGTGEVTATPDLAQIQLGVLTQAPTAKEALKKNNAAMTRLFTTLKGHQIAEKDLQTAQFLVSPQYRRDKQGRQMPEIVGYRVSNQVEVRVRQMSLLGEILDVVVSEGANQVQGIRFSVAEPARLLDEARRKAMADARRRAELYAEAGQVELGKVLVISEQTPVIPRPHYLGFAERAATAVPIAPGEHKFQVSITVTYGLEYQQR
jgi:uncharacterized protein YggE